VDGVDTDKDVVEEHTYGKGRCIQTEIGKGQKRPVPCSRDRSYTYWHAGEACPCPKDRLYTHDGNYISPTFPNLFHMRMSARLGDVSQSAQWEQG